MDIYPHAHKCFLPLVYGAYEVNDLFIRSAYANTSSVGLMSLKQALFYMIKQFPIVYIDCAVYSQLSNPFSKTSFSKTQVF